MPIFTERIPSELRENSDKTASDYCDKIPYLLKLYNAYRHRFAFFCLLSCDYAFFVVPLYA